MVSRKAESSSPKLNTRRIMRISYFCIIYIPKGADKIGNFTGGLEHIFRYISMHSGEHLAKL